MAGLSLAIVRSSIIKMDNDQRKQFAKENLIPIADAWALVAMADRINGGRYIKLVECDPETGNVTFRPNRDIIANQVALGLVNVRPEDRELGDRMADHFRGLAFDALSGEMKEFDQKIINLITQPTLDATLGMAYLACMGARYHRELVKEYKQEIINRVAGTSTHQGNVGQLVNITVKVVAKFAGKAFPGSVVRATDGTNMYFWTSGQDVNMWPDAPEEFPIIGFIKGHGLDRDGTAETQLTRVKIRI
jgi:hypothetical protein